MSIWVTRVAPYHLALLERLSMLGASPEHVPLVAIRPLELDPASHQIVYNLDRYDHVVFVSRTAIDFALPLFEGLWPQWPDRQTWWTMGPGSADLLRQHHAAVRYADPSTTEGLLAQLSGTDLRDEKWLIVRGRGGRELLRDSLICQGAQVDYLELYRREPLAISEEKMASVTTIFVSSTQNLLSLKQFSKIIARRDEITLVVPSQRTQQMAIELGFDQVITATGADDDAMLTAWQNYKDQGE